MNPKYVVGQEFIRENEIYRVIGINIHIRKEYSVILYTLEKIGDHRYTYSEEEVDKLFKIQENLHAH